MKTMEGTTHDGSTYPVCRVTDNNVYEILIAQALILDDSICNKF